MKLRKGWKLTYKDSQKDLEITLNQQEYQYLLATVWGRNGFKGWIKKRVFILSD